MRYTETFFGTSRVFESDGGVLRVEGKQLLRGRYIASFPLAKLSTPPDRVMVRQENMVLIAFVLGAICLAVVLYVAIPPNEPGSFIVVHQRAVTIVAIVVVVVVALIRPKREYAVFHWSAGPPAVAIGKTKAAETEFEKFVASLSAEILAKAGA